MQNAPAVDLPANLLEITLALALAATLAVAAALTAGRLVRRLLTAVGRESALTEPVVHGTLRALRLVTFIIVLAVLAFPALELAGVSLQVGLHPRDLGRWAAATGIRITVILLLAFALVRILTTVITRTERDLALGTGLDALERRKRAQTVATVVSRALSALVWATAILVVLRELDVDITPVEVLGVDDFKDSSVSLRFRIKTIPLKQWEVGRELRRRVKLILDREGIRIPSPRMDVTITREHPPGSVAAAPSTSQQP